MSPDQIKNILEAALMVADSPLSVNRLLLLFEKDNEPPQREQIRTSLEQLRQDYEGRGLELVEVASGFRFQARREYAEWVNHLFDDRPQRYSRALLETLAIIAYRQPVTRGEIENIRGVSVSSNIVKTLQEREWVRVVGHRDVPGRPELLATTRQFLDYFNLKKLSDLPTLAEIKDFEHINPDLFDSLNSTQIGEPAIDDNSAEEAATEPVDTGTDDNVVPFSG
ncbi:MAG: SMC-Scp complex subunit ScpB [Gammaproteobacteria bacterium]